MHSISGVIRIGSALVAACRACRSPWDVALLGRLFPSGSLTVLRHKAPSTPHARIPYDLSFSLTDNWNVAWKPPFWPISSCLDRRGPRPSPNAEHSPAILSYVPRETLTRSPCGIQPSGPHHLCGQRRSSRTVRHSAYILI